MDAGVTFLLEKVTEVIRYYGDLVVSASTELTELERDLGEVKSCLDELATKTDKRPRFKYLEKELRELVYEVEDTLDACLKDADDEATAAATAATAKVKKIWRSSKKCTPKSINLMERVKSLRQEKVAKMLGKANNLLNSPSAESVSGGEEPATLVEKDKSIRQDKVVGFEDEEKTINGFLLEEKEEVDVISIVGLPGQGKTTLTWKIYNSDEMQRRFLVRLWLSVSQKPNKKALLQEILRKFTGEDMSKLNINELEKKVKGYLKDKTFLIVLDDVWKVDDWKSIENALPMSNSKGKIIITTRMQAVGTAAGLRKPHELRFLDKDESWTLLQLEVFGDVNVCPVYLTKTGKEVAKNCDGLPLTIVVIGGLLVAQYTRPRPPGVIKTDWENVSKDVTEFIKEDGDNHIMKVVRLSYDILPDELRVCFLYMGVFPEDHEIPAWTLTRLWIAEGFIQKNGKRSLEATAELYLNDLINRNLVMAGRRNPMGENKTCRVHDVIRAFCTSTAEEQNLFKEIKKSDDGFLEPTAAEIHNYHRLCIHSELTMFLSEALPSPTIRSFLCFQKNPSTLPPEQTTAIPDAFKILRVFDFDSIKLKKFPTALTNLIHLRYITLNVEQHGLIPGPIAKLWNLQTLVLHTGSGTLTMAANLWRMARLRNLKSKAAIVLDDQKWQGEAGENLQTLSNLAPESFTENVSRRARNLKRLGVLGNLGAEFDTRFLANLKRLEKLKLVNDRYYGLNLPGLPNLPNWLKRLTLKNTLLNAKDLSTLAKIQSLEVLKLKEAAFIEKTWEAFGSGFPGLQFLLIESGTLEDWEASAEHFPVLTSLSIKCQNLKKIPMEMSANLLRLDIAHSPHAIESARDIQKQNVKGQESQKLRYGVRFELNVGLGCELS